MKIMLIVPVAIVAILFLGGCTGEFAMTDASGNVTAGTLELGSLTADDVGIEALTSLSESLERIASSFLLGIGILLVVSLLVVSLWYNVVFFYAISGFATFTLGVTWALDYEGFNYVFIFIASYQLIKAVINAIESDKASSGMSQFRGIINRIKDWF